MPEEFDRILEAVKRNLNGKINPKTKKPYTESEIYAIATEQYNKTKEKSLNLNTVFCKSWSEVKDGDTTEYFIEATVSGIKEDRDGERIDDDAIEDMITQFKSGFIPFFPNHGRDSTGERVYNWKDIMGKWVDARRDGDNLKATVKLNKANPDAMLFLEYVKQGMPVGLSIGGKPVMVEEEEIDEL